MPVLSIPVKLHTPNAVFTETEGLLKLDEGRLVLEYETKDAFFGAYRSGVDELEMLPDDVASVTFKKGLFKASIVIRARSLKKVQEVPGSKLGEVTLHVKRKHRADAGQLATFLQARLLELEVSGVDTPAHLPDASGDEVSGESSAPS